MPQKAERLRDVIMTALRSGTNPNQFDSILPDVCRFLSQDCYVDKWKPHTITDIVDTGDKIVGAFTAEQYSNQNKSFAALIACISDDVRKMMIAYENNRPITEVQPQHRCVLIVMTRLHLLKLLYGKMNLQGLINVTKRARLTKFQLADI